MINLLTTKQTGRDARIYSKFRDYVNQCFLESPPIVCIPTPTEPVSTVQEYHNLIWQGHIPVWEGHFHTKHLWLTPTEYGIWRSTHDYFGHYAQWLATNKQQGHFNMKGEFDSVWSVVRDTQDVDIVEGVILETISRNLVDTPEAFPVATEATHQLALSYFNK